MKQICFGNISLIHVPYFDKCVGKKKINQCSLTSAHKSRAYHYHVMCEKFQNYNGESN